MEKHIDITMHPQWGAYFKSPKGQANVLDIIKTLADSKENIRKERWYPSSKKSTLGVANKEEDSISRTKSIALSLIMHDSRLSQFIPSDILEEIGTPCTVGDVIALADLSGLKTDLGNDLLFTALAFLSHGVVKVESFYSTGTDQCDFSHTEAWALKRTASYETSHLTQKTVSDKAWAYAVADKYNLDTEIFYESLCSNGGAGDGTVYNNSFVVTFIGKFEVEDRYLGEDEDQYHGDEEEEN